jgi:hypothetical protein
MRPVVTSDGYCSFTRVSFRLCLPTVLASPLWLRAAEFKSSPCLPGRGPSRNVQQTPQTDTANYTVTAGKDPICQLQIVVSRVLAQPEAAGMILVED